MRFYVSWYSGDPEYQQIDGDSRVLISPTSVSKAWHIEDFRFPPRSIMIDSGSFHFIDTNGQRLTKTQNEVFEEQIRILGDFKPAIISHLDFAIPRTGISEPTMKERIEITIDNAEKFFDLCLSNTNRLEGVVPLAVIQGYDTESVLYCARRLRAIGFKKFGLGSVARLSRIKRSEILNRVAKVMEIVGDLHIFGVSSIEIMKKLRELKVSSVDSATPIKESIYSGIIYSKPFRRYKIGTEYFTNKWSRRYGYAKILKKPAPCDCPICVEIGMHAIMQRGRKLWNNLRALHNYYHLKRELFGRPPKPPKESNLIYVLTNSLDKNEMRGDM